LIIQSQIRLLYREAAGHLVEHGKSPTISGKCMAHLSDREVKVGSVQLDQPVSESSWRVGQLISILFDPSPLRAKS